MKKNEKKSSNFISFFEKHFVAKRRNCPKCGRSVDGYINCCPYCHEKIDDSILPARFQNMIFLSDYKLLMLTLFGILGFVFFGYLLVLVFSSVPMDDNLSSILVNLISSILILSTFAIILRSDNKEILNSFKKTFHHLRPIAISLIGLAVIVAFTYIYQGIFALCNYPIADNDNQTRIIQMCQNWPALAFFYVVLLAPLTEELTYRLGLFTLLRKRNRYLSYIVAILLFTIGHFNFVAKDMVNECINLPLYVVPAFILTAVYEYGGISSSFCTHFLNNLISYIIILTVR